MLCLVFQEFLNYLGNYLPNQWNFKDGCVTCTDDTFSLDSLKVITFPSCSTDVGNATILTQAQQFIVAFNISFEWPRKFWDLQIIHLEM